MEMSSSPIHFATARDWRAWLEEHHGTRDEAWLLISKKHAGTPSVTLTEATEEALCFGWIDSLLQPIDEERYALRYTPRRAGSNWSDRMKRWAIALIEDGRMTEAGLAKIEEAKRNGRWGEDPLG